MKRRELPGKGYLIPAIAALLIIAIAAGVLPRLFDHELQRCIEEKERMFPPNNETIVRGHIIVKFKGNATESEAFELIHQHGLGMKEFMGSFMVYVPSGDEYKWLCILENSEIVEYTAINYNTKG